MAKIGEATEDILWKQYALSADLYKTYLDVLLRFNAFYYAVTGAILSFYFSKENVATIKFALLLPVLMSIGCSIVLFFAANAMTIARNEMVDLSIRLGLEAAPEYNVLKFLLFVSALLMLVVAVVLVLFFFAR